MNGKRRAHTRGAGGTEERPLDWPGDPESLTARSGRLRGPGPRAGQHLPTGRATQALPFPGGPRGDDERGDEDLGGPGGGRVREAALYALLAEASVAWLGADAAHSLRPTDRMRRLCGRVQVAVLEAAGLDGEPSAEQAELLRFIARMAEAAEARDVPGAGEGAATSVAFPPLDRRIRLLDPARAARLWLDRFHDLKRPPDAGGSAAAPRTDEAGESNEEKQDGAHVRTAPEAQSPMAGGSHDAA